MTNYYILAYLKFITHGLSQRTHSIPVLDDSWLDKTGLVIALGSYCEQFDDTTMGADHLIVDYVERSLRRGVLADLAYRGEISEADFDATIGEVLTAVMEIKCRTAIRPC